MRFLTSAVNIFLTPPFFFPLYHPASPSVTRTQYLGLTPVFWHPPAVQLSMGCCSCPLSCPLTSIYSTLFFRLCVYGLLSAFCIGTLTSFTSAVLLRCQFFNNSDRLATVACTLDPPLELFRVVGVVYSRAPFSSPGVSLMFFFHVSCDSFVPILFISFGPPFSLALAFVSLGQFNFPIINPQP